MKRTLVVVLVSFLVGCAPSEDESQRQPNILFILTDDQGWPTLGSYGGDIVPTPNLDRIAAEGARFTSAYVTPLCTPTRATLMSGQYVARSGMFHVIINPWYGSPFARMEELPYAGQYPRDEFTVAKGLKAAGYTTGMVGKWHLTTGRDGEYMGINPEYAPLYGFDWAGPVISRDEFAEGGDRGVMTLTDQAIEFISQAGDKPWFCFVSHHMIHSDVVAPDDIAQEYRDKGYGDVGPNRAIYLAGLDIIDRSVGRLLGKLEELGQANATMIVFLTDNGGVDDRHEHRSMEPPHPPAPKFGFNLQEYSNSPLRDGKGSHYEGGVRVPMVVRWPGTIEPGTVIDTPVHAIDIAPTFLEAASASSPADHHLDGVSLTRLMRTGTDDALEDRPLYQYYPSYDFNWGLTPSASMRRGDYKLIEFFGDRVDEHRQYIPGRRVELYNLRDDIGEQNNLAEADPERTESMTKQLHDWMEEVGAKPSGANPHHDPERAFVTTREKPDWVQAMP